MGIYGNRRVVKRERYKNYHVEILEINRGGRHCDVDHDVTARRCGKCGAKIAPHNVFLIQVNGDRIDDPEFDNADSALATAKKWIDSWESSETDNPPGADDDDEIAEDAGSGGSASDVEARLLKQMKQLGWGSIALRIISQGKREANR
jgi:hypothetical protein